MAIATRGTRPTSTATTETASEPKLRLTPGTYQRRPWQIALGVTLVVVCAALVAAAFQSSAKRASVLVAAKSLAAGTVIVSGDLAIASIPTSGNITAISAAGSSGLIGRQLDEPVYAGQLLVRQMISSSPELGSGQQVVGLLVKGDQAPSVPLVPGAAVQVVAVPQPGQGSTIGSSIGSVLVPSATVFAVGPAPADQTQFQESISIEVPGADAALVTAYAAADQIGLSLISEPDPEP